MNFSKLGQDGIDPARLNEFHKLGPRFFNLTYVLFGLYQYEFLLSLDFDWEFLTRKKQFRWPLIFYFANRYCVLAAIIATVIVMDIKTKINCAALYTFIQLAAAASVGLANINLSIRTIALWSSNKYIVGGLIFAIIGQWCLIFQVGRLKARRFDTVSESCYLQGSDTKLLPTFIYAVCFNLIILLLAGYKLFVLNPSNTLGRSRLAQIVFVHGLNFFMIAFVANLATTIFITSYTNSDIIFSAPAAVFCTIAGCRAVRRFENCVQNVNANHAEPKPTS